MFSLQSNYLKPDDNVVSFSSNTCWKNYDQSINSQQQYPVQHNPVYFSPIGNQNSILYGSQSFYHQTNLSSIDFSSDNANEYYKNISNTNNFNMNMCEQYANSAQDFLNHSQMEPDMKQGQSIIQQHLENNFQCSNSFNLSTLKNNENVQYSKSIKFSEIIETAKESVNGENDRKQFEKTDAEREFSFNLRMPEDMNNYLSAEFCNNGSIVDSSETISFYDANVSRKNKRKQSFSDELLDSDQPSTSKKLLDATPSLTALASSLGMGLISRGRGRPKSSRITLADALLEDDERIDGTVKLEWVIFFYG